ncbi:PQQ-dependent sugar dehydrogenase [Microbacterium sp. Bi121]|uniref:PQQ-dependent sugar dehydrogenase n=1 Tax=Microbacterium sp. Bi121 TaxID=2822348 RepID=UPI001DC44F0D|nr:PQQ-dependent sugar dehydrogenase [Microbacterium sp. Bi121]CAH0202293.1 Aldose sugar dehydrogenase YliI [Microbacterium sp. Bi121]
MYERTTRTTDTSGPGDSRAAGRRAAAGIVALAVVGSALTAMPAAAAESFTEVLSFEQYERTALDGQDGWTASGALRVIADPLNGNNQVLESVGGGQQAYRTIPAIDEGDTGTLFFRFMRTGSVDTSFGLTDVDAPNDYANSRAYINNQNDNVMLVRDGGKFTPAGAWSKDSWQCVWIVADNAADKVSVYSQGGPYEEITRLPEGAEQQFGFRQAVNGALDRFFWKNGASSTGRLMLDDVAVDTTGENLAIATGNPGDCAPGETPTDPLLNPLPDPPRSDLGIEVTELAQLPESHTTPATQDQRLVRHNRITHLDEVPDGTGRLMVPDNNGTLYLVDKKTGDYVPYLDVRDEFLDNFHNSAGLGTGLGAAEFDPDFADNGKFYTVHTEGGTAITEDTPDFPEFGNTEFHSVITEWTADDPSAATFTGSHREIMRIPFGGRVHTVQQIAFNPTVKPGDADYGNLYVLVGDGGTGVGNGNPQDLATPQGKIMRITPSGDNSANGEYGVPTDNPFVDDADALPEIYAVGMRDPHRISWDPEGDHTMYLAHIGEWQVESIYAVEPGDNFGWSEREGPFLAENRQIYPLPADDAENGYTYPVAAYDHNRDPGQTGDAGVAVNGGFVYRGDIPELQGRYLFTDLVRGWVLSADSDEMVRNDGDIDDLAPIEELRVFVDGQETTFQELVGDKRVDLRFGSDADGELYLIAKANGKIWKVTGAKTVDPSPFVLPELAENLVTRYDFDHPSAGAAAFETDQGRSGTDISLVNGGVEMRVADRAYPGAGEALQTQQMSPSTASNDDWKAGVYDASGVDSLKALGDTDKISVMGWFKPTGDHPAPNSGTENPDDVYNAIGLAGVLTGTSNGHDVRALLEVITVNGELKLVALGRRVDGQGSWTFAADKPWDEILQKGKWVHLAATFDFTAGEMKLYMNGEELAGTYTASNPWGSGPVSASAPAGIKIGGSFPQNDREANPFNGRMDDIAILDTVPTAEQIAAQYALFAVPPTEGPVPPTCTPAGTPITDVMAADDWTPRTPAKWDFPGDEVVLTEAGTDPNDGIRRPFEYAVLDEGPELGSFDLSAQVRLDEPASVNNRDVILVFGWKSDTEYYYTHLSQDNTIYAHNGIFKVNNADRERIDDQWDGKVGAPPAVTDEQWHDVRVVRCVDSGDIAVYVDGLDTPLFTANDDTFGEGRVGFGSFDNFGRIRNLTVTPALEDATAPAVTVKEGAEFTVGSGGVYSKVSFKLHDEGKVSRLTLNGVEKDLTDDVWSDLNSVTPGQFGAVAGKNTLVVYDVAGNATTITFTLDVTAPTVTVKEGEQFTVGADGVYSKVSFKLNDAGKVSRLTLNGKGKDLTDNVWSDLDFVAPGRFGAAEGENTLVVYDVAGNATTLKFTLGAATP